MKSEFSFGASLRLLLVFLLYSAMFAGCASTKQSISEHPTVDSASSIQKIPTNMVVPAGVDSAVAVAATLAARQVIVGWAEDSVARQLFNAGNSQLEEGRPLLDAIQKGKATAEPISSEDSAQSIDLLNQANLTGAKGDRIIGNKTPGRLTKNDLAKYSDDARSKAAAFYEAARDLYERALLLNPWDSEIRTSLLVTYRDLVTLHLALNDLDAEIKAIEKYLDLYGEQYGYLTQLARCWEEKGDTVRTLLCYRRAEDALLSWAPTSWDPALDSSRTGLSAEQYKNWLALITEEYKSDLALQLTAPTMADLLRLRSTCRPESDTTTLGIVKDLVAWLQWDDGNIESVQLRGTLREQIQAEQWDEAKKTVNKLLPKLRKPSALFETRYTAAQIDFYRLGEYETGLSEMRNLLDESGFFEVNDDLDSLLAGDGRKAFADRMREQRQEASDKIVSLLDDYGNCCLSYGIQLETSAREKEKAFIYYYQSALIPWKRQGTAIGVLADMSKNQPDRTILYGETALLPGFEEELDPTSRGTVYAALREAYRRKNDRAHTDFYHRALMELSSEAKK